MKVTLQQVTGSTMAARANSNHWGIIDFAENEGGTAAGSSPMEWVLMGLGSCTSVDILLMLKKMRATVRDFTVTLEAERAETHPRVFTKVHMDFYFEGEGLKSKDIDRAIRLSLEKYCSVAGMVSKTAELTTSYRVNSVE